MPAMHANSAKRNETAENRVKRRFSQVSLEHPLTEVLYGLALECEAAREQGPDFSKDMRSRVPDAPELMDMKRKFSLLPMDTVDKRIKLPALPSIIVRLQEALSDGASSDEIAEILMPDPKLTTVILSLANSSMYSFSQKVESLSRAVTLIGSKEISSLALGMKLLSMFEDADAHGLPLLTFWKHSIACAVLSHELAVLCGKDDPERFFVAGLLHDLGRVILFTNYPEMAAVVLAVHRSQSIPLQQAELKAFDVDHTLIGGVFFAKWDMPKGVVNAALHHHSPERALGKETAETVYIANQIATALGLGCNGMYTMQPGEALWHGMNISESGLSEMLHGIDGRLKAFYSMIFQ